MYIFINSVKNILRNKGRNLTIGVLILGMIISTVIGFSINTTTEEIIKDYKDRFGSEVSISLAPEKMAVGAMTYAPLESKFHYAISESEYLKEYRFSGALKVKSDSVKAIDEDVEIDTGGMQTSIQGQDGTDIDMPTMTVLGYSSLESLEEFKDGKRKIIEGEMFKNKDECVISKELAEVNNLKVGDFINVNFVNFIDKDIPDYEVKITGIYFDSTDPYSGMTMKIPAINRRNEIITNLETIKGIGAGYEIYIDGKYYLKSPDMLEAFEKEARAKGLPADYVVTTDEASYNRIVGPVEGLGSITKIFLGVVLALGSVILILLNNLSIRERKYEIGVLRAIGMKKGKVALGLIYESLIITVICLGIGVGFGGVISQPITNVLLEQQVEAQKNSQLGQSQLVTSIDQNSESQESTISNIDVKLNGKALLEVAGVSILIVLVSSVVGVSYITKYEPSKILRERG